MVTLKSNRQTKSPKSESKHAIVYLRVSTEDQAKYGLSMDNQEARGRQYAQLAGYTDIQVVRDDGKSGTNANRSGLQAVMEAVRKKEVAGVTVYSLSRFMRNTKETIEAIDLMKAKGVTFHSLTESIDTSTAMGKFFLVVMAGVAELESGQTGERIRSVMEAKKLRGERVGSIPYGFKMGSKTEKGRTLLAEDEFEQGLIATIRQLRRGHSLQGVCDTLFAEGLTTRTGKKFSVTQIVRILKGA